MVEECTAEPTRWIEVRVRADAESVDAVAEWLGRFGGRPGVLVQQAEEQANPPSHAIEEHLGAVDVSTCLPLDACTPGVLRRIEEGLFYLGCVGRVGPFETIERPEGWPEVFSARPARPPRVGAHFVIKPPWCTYDAQPDDVVIDIDPGTSFGTGFHPSTALCMRWLEEIDLRCAHVLDAGAGSGVLTLAALRCGAAHVDAAEIDRDAVVTLRKNIAHNDVEGQVRVVEGDVSAALASGERYDLIVANMVAPVLVRCAAALGGAAGPGTTLALSGLSTETEDDVVRAYHAKGFVVHARRAWRDWVTLLARKETS